MEMDSLGKEVGIIVMSEEESKTSGLEDHSSPVGFMLAFSSLVEGGYVRQPEEGEGVHISSRPIEDGKIMYIFEIKDETSVIDESDIIEDEASDVDEDTEESSIDADELKDEVADIIAKLLSAEEIFDKYGNKSDKKEAGNKAEKKEFVYKLDSIDYIPELEPNFVYRYKGEYYILSSDERMNEYGKKCNKSFIGMLEEHGERIELS